MNYSLPGSYVHGIFQARILEWVAISSPRGSSQPRNPTCISCTGRQILYRWATREAHVYTNMYTVFKHSVRHCPFATVRFNKLDGLPKEPQIFRSADRTAEASTKWPTECWNGRMQIVAFMSDPHGYLSLKHWPKTSMKLSGSGKKKKNLKERTEWKELKKTEMCFTIM